MTNTTWNLIEKQNEEIKRLKAENTELKSAKAALSEAWKEYDYAAEDMAKKGLKGAIGDPLPEFMTLEAVKLINDDPEAFERRVKEMAYGLAMEKITHE
jgi:hypothetical protein